MCLDDPDFAKELVEENGWERMVHAGMDAETKEVAKETWGFKAVPYLVVIGTARSGAPGVPRRRAVADARVRDRRTARRRFTARPSR